MLNPYASFLKRGANPLDIIARTPQVLEDLARTIGPKRLQEPRAPGKWNTRQVLCHLADCEIAFGFRLRQALAEKNHIIQPFDQDAWAKQYDDADAKTALEAFTALRQWNVALIRSLSPLSLRKKVTHPERGPMTVKAIVETMAGHDLNHLQQIMAVAARSASA